MLKSTSMEFFNSQAMTSQARMRQTKRTAKRQSGSEGLRVLALIGVSAYHLRPDLVPAGFLGVVIFFALAGFYTTRSFVVRPEVDLMRYYGGKIKKLWPPLLFLCMMLALFCGFVIPEISPFLKDSAPPTLLGGNNIAQILADNSYFNRHGHFDPLVHLWALSMEMQFYLFFPLLYMGLSRICDHLHGRARLWGREASALFLLLLAAASALLMSWLYDPAVDPIRVYYGSLCRSHAFLNGAAASLWVAGRQMRKTFQGKAQRHLPLPLRTLVGWLSLLLLVASYFLFSWRSTFLFRGGFYLYSLLAVLYIYMAGARAVPGLRFFMESAPFRWLSSRSYELYLWQYALMIVFDAGLRFSKISFGLRLAVELPLLALLAELSYRIFRSQGSIRESLRSTLAVFLALALSVMLILPPPVQPQAPKLKGEAVEAAISENESRQAAQASRRAAQQAAKSTQTKKPSEKATPARTTAETTATPTTEAPGIVSDDNPFGYKASEVAKLAQLNLVMVGDSVLAMAMDGMRLYVPNVTIDAVVSRHFFQGPAVLQGILNSAVPADIIVVCLATNGDLNADDIPAYKALAGDRPLIFVNTVVPGSWEQPNNEKLASYAQKEDNVYIADWYAAAKNHPEYFYQDATHPIPKGAWVYDQVILDLILQILNEKTQPSSLADVTQSGTAESSD